MVNDSYESLDFQSANALAQIRAEQETDQTKTDQNAKPDQTDSEKEELRYHITRLQENISYLKNVMHDAGEEFLGIMADAEIDSNEIPNLIRLIKEAGVDIPMESKTVTVDVTLNLSVEVEVELPITLSEHDDVTDYIDQLLPEAIEDGVRNGDYNTDNYDVTDVS
jgi:hypothetical protein